MGYYNPLRYLNKVSFISLFSRIVTIGVRALIDYFFQSVKEENYVFYKEEAYEASSFTEKYDVINKEDNCL